MFSSRRELNTAEEIGAPHRRERLFVLATRLSDADRVDIRKQSKRCQSNSTARRDTQPFDIGEAVAHTAGLLFPEIPTAGTSGVGCIGEKPAYIESDDRWCEFSEKGSRFRWAGPAGVSEELGNTDDIHVGEAVVRETGVRGHYQPGILFPPGRNDLDGSRALLDECPDLVPAIESPIRQPPHGHPYWVDELRLNGNGVVPLQAAYALATLLVDVGE